jgi:NADH dehydrogenase FAD-containing subunit
VQVVSPRNHMVFTPLLASTTVGTLEARSVALHITTIQKALKQPQNQYVQVRPGQQLDSSESCDRLQLLVA